MEEEECNGSRRVEGGGVEEEGLYSPLVGEEEKERRSRMSGRREE